MYSVLYTAAVYSQQKRLTTETFPETGNVAEEKEQGYPVLKFLGFWK